MQETYVQSWGQEDPLEKGIATHTSILENPMDRGAWWATVQEVTESDATERLSTQAQCLYNYVILHVFISRFFFQESTFSAL